MNGLEHILRIASSSCPALGWTLPTTFALELIDRFDLEPKQRRGDMTGERSALFDFEGETLRLKLCFPSRWKIFRGDWKPDPRWTGD